ncbi:MAG: hypothetical protein ACXWCR_14180 [Flavitalea sp.]
MPIKIYLPFLLVMMIIFSCTPAKKLNQTTVSNNQESFWKSLQSLCGNSYEGELVAGPSNDTMFTNKKLIMHVRSCNSYLIRIPFVVGTDLSRTWVITKTLSSMILQHDHRHRDGTEDSVNFYGGHTSNSGSKTIQFFPADQHTTNQLPAAAGNVWWIEIIPGQSFSYNLRRMGTDRYFSIRFDLTKTVAAPWAPWGWKD